MLNFRKIRQDFSQNLIKEGKELFDKGKVLSAEVQALGRDSIRVRAKVAGQFDHHYDCDIEIDRDESELIDSNCDCPYHSDCQHLAALVFHLEQNLDGMVVHFGKGVDLSESMGEEEQEEVMATLAQAKGKEDARLDEAIQREMLNEYVHASQVLGTAPFFLPSTASAEENVEILVCVQTIQARHVELQLALRLPNRSKPVHVLQLRQFLEAVRYEEPTYLAGRRWLITLSSFAEHGRTILRGLMAHGRTMEGQQDRQSRVLQLDLESFGDLLADLYDQIPPHEIARRGEGDDASVPIPGIMWESLDQPMRVGRAAAQFRFTLEALNAPEQRIFLQPSLWIEGREVRPEAVTLLECVHPGLITDGTYHRFGGAIRRAHLRCLREIQDLAIPEPLMGTLIEYSLPALRRHAQITPCAALARCLTRPATGPVEAICRLTYVDGELEACMSFLYEGYEVPADPRQLQMKHLQHFCTDQGVLARQLTEERALLEELFQDFQYKVESGLYSVKSDRRIVEFMTEIVPRLQGRVQFDCPKALTDQFIYDQSEFSLEVRLGSCVDHFEIALTVQGDLRGVKTELLWDCLAAKRSFIELPPTHAQKDRTSRILVLDLDRLGAVVQLFDELGIETLDTHIEQRPLWTLVSLQPEQMATLPLKFSIAPELLILQQQMLGVTSVEEPVDLTMVKATLRRYQVEGVQWLNRLRKMHLNGILADDMGLGKTVQAITALCHVKEVNPKATALVVCPTSLLYNWQEELHKFAPQLTTLVIDGVPAARKKLLAQMEKADVVITSYTLLQKDVEVHRKRHYTYAILDEAQHIKNRGTRNAKSVKLIHAQHRLILSGTPVENSLEEMWSLFDFLMPGLLGTFERFQEKYMRQGMNSAGPGKVIQGRHLEPLRKKVAPFILRRMKADVLEDLPPITESIYHCQLSAVQQDLYRSYAASARAELTRLVSKEGFEKVQIHVLATLTRLKQICCHPGIFAKEEREEGDSAKYEMMLDLLQSLIEGGHKTVIFSQYTRMLQIMREDFTAQGIRFCYLDGSSKNRLDIVNQFNEDPTIPVFLVSLKAGGTGLNLVGADTVIHYDIWWNPAVENQATDRVHRLGQDRPVTAFKLVTLQTIEEKILQMQQRKRGLVKKVVSCDDEALAKLTWEEVLELLQT